MIEREFLRLQDLHSSACDISEKRRVEVDSMNEIVKRVHHMSARIWTSWAHRDEALRQIHDLTAIDHREKTHEKPPEPKLILNPVEACHTEEECVKLWAEIPLGKKVVPLVAVSLHLSTVTDQIRSVYVDNNGKPGWMAKYHIYWGTWFRNWLRNQGWGEEYWPVHNLDCIYMQLLEEALGLKMVLNDDRTARTGKAEQIPPAGS
jgi:hypothetical protein